MTDDQKIRKKALKIALSTTTIDLWKTAKEFESYIREGIMPDEEQ